MKALYQRIKSRREADGLSTNAGFTLIELLIVIVVLGILAGVVIFALGGITGKSAVAACQADGATVSTAISAFQAQNPGVAVTPSALTTTTTSTGGPYLQTWPSNLPHYAYAIDVASSPGTDEVSVTGAKVGSLMIAVAPAGSVNPATSTFVAYAGPTSCKNVQ